MGAKCSLLAIEIRSMDRYPVVMKIKDKNKNSNWVQVVRPFGDGLLNDKGFFDDCPVCQELKLLVDAGIYEVVEDEMDIN